MSIDFNAPQFMLPGKSHALEIPESGLPNGRGIAIASSNNTSLASAQMVGSAHDNCQFNGSLTPSDSQDYYKVQVSGRQPLNALLSGVSANVDVELLNADGTVLQNSANAAFAAAKPLSADLQPGTYYVRVRSLDSKATDYSLTLMDGKTYYVATDGSDTNAGSFAAPFQTVQHAAEVAAAGDTIFLRGGTYYERQIRMQGSGTADAPITFEATPGEMVVIDHGLRVPSWQPQGGGIYQGTPIFPDKNRDKPNNTVRVVVDEKPLVRVSDRAELKEGTFWVNSTTGALDVWAFGGVNPGTRETSVLNRPGNMSIGDDALGFWIDRSANYIVVDGFVDRSADAAFWARTFNGSSIHNQGFVVKNCEIKFAWSNAVRVDEWNGALIENNNIHHNNQSAMPRSNDWPCAVIGVDSENIVINGNRVDHNYGEGIGPYKRTRDWKILNNFVHDNWSVNIYVTTDYGNIVVDGNTVTQTGTDTTYERSHPDGIRIANEIADILHEDPSPDVYNIQVTNNVIKGTGGGIRAFPYYDGSWVLKNSIISHNQVSEMYNNLPAIQVEHGVEVKVESNTTSGLVSIH